MTPSNFLNFAFSRYTSWLWAGVILTNRQFLYRVSYLLCSACGVIFSPFFYAFLLIDVCFGETTVGHCFFSNRKNSPFSKYEVHYFGKNVASCPLSISCNPKDY